MTETETPDDPAGRCAVCDRAYPSDFNFCPRCGNPLRDTGGRPLDPYQAAVFDRIGEDIRRERAHLRFWRPVAPQLYAAGALILCLPDAALIFLFHRWRSPALTLETAGSFLGIDVAIGALVVFLVLRFHAHGILGDLILLGLRGGQVSLVFIVGLMPFRQDILNLLLFFCLPILCAGVGSGVFGLHLSDLIDRLGAALSRSASDDPPADDHGTTR